MKRSVLITISLLLLLVLFLGCGESNSSQDEPQIETQSEEKAPETHYTENQIEMSNYMNEGSVLVADGWVYTVGYDTSVECGTLTKMRTDGSEKTVLSKKGSPSYITIQGEYIYVVLTSDDSRDLYRLRLGGEDQAKLIKNVRFFRILDDYMYYCTVESDDNNKTVAFYRADLEGKNKELVLDKEIYNPYLLGDELYYQDDADKETVHKYCLSTKEDERVTDTYTYSYVLNDDCMYCVENDNSILDEDYVGSLVKIDLQTREKTVLYDGVSIDINSLAALDDELYFINANDECRIYRIDKSGDNINLISQDDYCGNILVFDNQIAYGDWEENYEIFDHYYLTNKDGSDKTDIFHIE